MDVLQINNIFKKNQLPVYNLYMFNEESIVVLYRAATISQIINYLIKRKSTILIIDSSFVF